MLAGRTPTAAHLGDIHWCARREGVNGCARCTYVGRTPVVVRRGTEDHRQVDTAQVAVRACPFEGGCRWPVRDSADGRVGPSSVLSVSPPLNKNISKTTFFHCNLYLG